MENKIIPARFRAVDRYIFQAIKTGAKKVETRAATTKYRNLRVGDHFHFYCDGEMLDKEIKHVRHFDSIDALAQVYPPHQINPKISSIDNLKKMYKSFPGYAEEIRKSGVMAFELR